MSSFFFSRGKDKEYGVSRGVDFQNIANVINFDFPSSVESYIHRVGRWRLQDFSDTFTSPDSTDSLMVCSCRFAGPRGQTTKERLSRSCPIPSSCCWRMSRALLQEVTLTLGVKRVVFISYTILHELHVPSYCFNRVVQINICLSRRPEH